MVTDLSSENCTIVLFSPDTGLKEQFKEILAGAGLRLDFARLPHKTPAEISSDTVCLCLLDCRDFPPQQPLFSSLMQKVGQPDATPMIAICTATDTGRIGAAFQAGFHDVITLPLAQKEVSARLQARISAHLRSVKQQQELLEQQERFQKLAEASSEGILIHENGRILEINQALLTMIGYGYDEVIGLDATEFLSQESRQTARAHFKNSSEHSYALFATRKNGLQFPVIIQGRQMQWRGRTIQVVAVRDLSMQSFIHQEQQTLSVTLGEKDHFGSLVGSSRAMRKVYEKILRSAVTEAPVMLYGETGTGKELTARMIFAKSDHHTACFLPVNCASIPADLFESQFFGHRKGAFTGADFNLPGYFSQARGGTLFLDEIGELPMNMQAKLLRVLEDHTYTPVGGSESVRADVRIITATNTNLHDLERQGRFRSDFYYRLNVLSIDLPPLRARKEDIPLLVSHFFKLQDQTGKRAHGRQLPPSLLKQCEAHDWPGNVRELFNALERYLVDGELRLESFQENRPPLSNHLDFLGERVSLQEAVDRFERYYIHQVLQQHQGQKNRTAQALRIDRKTLYSKLRKHLSRRN